MVKYSACSVTNLKDTLKRDIFVFAKMAFIKTISPIHAKKFVEMLLFISCHVMMVILMTMMDALINAISHKGSSVK